jgi:hypothetical protein
LYYHQEVIESFKEIVMSIYLYTTTLLTFSTTTTTTSIDRNDIVSGSDEYFYRRVKLEENTSPFFNYIGINFIYIQRNRMYFVISTRKNVSPLTCIELLNRLCTLFKDYTGILSEESLRKNFSLMYELLDEVCDYGSIQTTSSEGIKHFVFNDYIDVEATGGIISTNLKLFNNVCIATLDLINIHMAIVDR